MQYTSQTQNAHVPSGLQVIGNASNPGELELAWPRSSKKRRSCSASHAGSTIGRSCSLGPEASSGSMKRPRMGPRAVVRLRRELASAAEQHGLRVEDLAALAALEPRPALPDDLLADVACKVCILLQVSPRNPCICAGSWLRQVDGSCEQLTGQQLRRQQLALFAVLLLMMCDDCSHSSLVCTAQGWNVQDS